MKPIDQRPKAPITEEASLERPTVLDWLRNDVGREIPRAGRRGPARLSRVDERRAAQVILPVRGASPAGAFLSPSDNEPAPVEPFSCWMTFAPPARGLPIGGDRGPRFLADRAERCLPRVKRGRSQQSGRYRQSVGFEHVTDLSAGRTAEHGRPERRHVGQRQPGQGGGQAIDVRA